LPAVSAKEKIIPAQGTKSRIKKNLRLKNIVRFAGNILYIKR